MKKLLLLEISAYVQLLPIDKRLFYEILLVVDSADGVCAELPIRVLNYSTIPFI